MESNSVEDIKLNILDTTELLTWLQDSMLDNSCDVIFIATDKLLENAKVDDELKMNLLMADAIFPSANIKILDNEEAVIVEEKENNGEEVVDTYNLDEKFVTEITENAELEKLSVMVMTDDNCFSDIVKEKMDSLSDSFQYIGEYVFENEIDDDLVINEINANLPDILLCSFNSPLQEKWIIENKSKMNVKLCMALSGTDGNFILKRDSNLKWITRLFSKTHIFGINIL